MTTSNGRGQPPKTDPKSETIRVRVTPKLKKRVQKLADKDGVSISQAARNCIEKVTDKAGV